MIRILTFTTLYPSSVRLRHGVFIENRLRRLIKGNRIRASVLAPVPWFPSSWSIFRDWATYARVPKHEVLNEIDVLHPRYLVIPKVGMSVTPLFLAISAVIHIRRLKKNGEKIDVIDAHYYYPDGVAAIFAGKYHNIPVTISARGSDLNVLPKFFFPRLMIKWAIRHASINLCVSDALNKRLVELGADTDSVITARNGVDLDHYKPDYCEETRKLYFPPSDFLILSVGNLIELKGHDLLIQAMSHLSNMSLTIIGRGGERENLLRLAHELGVSSRVYITDEMPPSELARIYSSADVFALVSSREGMPNVVLEAMACGTPVVATAVGGIPEIVAAPAGILVDRNVEAICDGLIEAQNSYPSRVLVRAHASQFSWESTTELLETIFEGITK